MNFYSLDSFRYHLPASHIAQVPVHPPESARLLVSKKGSFQDRFFSDLPAILEKNSLILINDTRVLKARIRTKARIIRPSGTVQEREVELLFLEIVPSNRVLQFESMVFPGDAFPVGAKCEIGGKMCRVESISYRGRVFSSSDISSEQELYEFLEKNGEFPIPPYIAGTKDAQDNYQTVFAEVPGSLAAPTASLHFSEKLLSDIKRAGIEIHTATLHVGIGTFKTVNEPDIRNHRIHPEVGIIPLEIFEIIAKKRLNAQSVIGVGTTMIRLLESLPFIWNELSKKGIFPLEVQQWWNDCYVAAKSYESIRIEYLATQDGVLYNDTNIHKQYGFIRIREESSLSVVFDSSLFIYEGYISRVATAMITNFHLPESTLLMMVSALHTKNRIDSVYEHAISQGYRFYSFGDGCYLEFVQP